MHFFTTSVAIKVDDNKSHRKVKRGRYDVHYPCDGNRILYSICNWILARRLLNRLVTRNP